MWSIIVSGDLYIVGDTSYYVYLYSAIFTRYRVLTAALSGRTHYYWISKLWCYTRLNDYIFTSIYFFLIIIILRQFCVLLTLLSTAVTAVGRRPSS